MSECLRCDTVGVFNTFSTKENEKVCETCFKDIEIQLLKAENEKLRSLLKIAELFSELYHSMADDDEDTELVMEWARQVKGLE